MIPWKYEGDSLQLTQRIPLAQVLTGPFVLRLKVFSKHGLLPASLVKSLEKTTPNFHKWSEAVVASPSVTGIFNEEAIVANAKERFAKMRAQV